MGYWNQINMYEQRNSCITGNGKTHMHTHIYKLGFPFLESGNISQLPISLIYIQSFFDSDRPKHALN